MRKTISNGINRRAVYKFQCTGPCGRMKFTYVYDRAKSGKCLSCSKNQVDENQQGLFGSVVIDKEKGQLTQYDENGVPRVHIDFLPEGGF